MSRKMELHRVVAVAWERHRRMSGICDWLGVHLHVLESAHRGVRRYLELVGATLRLLGGCRPSVVLLQNPSLVLALTVIGARPFLGFYRIVMDAHNEAVTPFSYTQWPIPALARLAQKKADTTIVTNTALAATVRRNGGRPLVLPDRLPFPPAVPLHRVNPGVLQVMVVATFALDEPIDAILDAARELGSGYQFSITGNSAKLQRNVRERAPANVLFTGFMPEHDYWQMMAECDAVLDLSLKPECLVCGAYEALSLSKPMVLSGNSASRELFGEFAVFPEDHDSRSIASALRQLRADYEAIRMRIEQGREPFSARWSEAASALRQMIS